MCRRERCMEYSTCPRVISLEQSVGIEMADSGVNALMDG
jgi:hypothetical protein